MAIDRFENKDILNTIKTPVEHTTIYSTADSIKMSKITTAVSVDSLRFAETEKHIYSGDNLLSSAIDSLNYEISQDTETTSTYDIILNPEYDVRLAGVTKGYYSIVYNFLESFGNNININRISADSTELELTLTDSSNFGELYNIVNSQTEYTEDFVLNFGKNELVPIVGFDFNNNPRVGEVVQDVLYPSSDGKTWYPVSNNDENFWIEFTTSTMRTTGRAAKYNPIVNESGNISFEIERDSNGDGIIYTNTPGDASRYFDVVSNASLIGRRRYVKDSAKIRYYNPSLKSIDDLKTVVVKLYRPLKDSLQPLRCSINRMVRDSYIERLLVYPYVKEVTQENFSSPNFKIDLGNYGKSQGTDLKTWNSLLDSSLATSQQIVDKYLSASLGTVTLNIDYSNIANWANYSSAVERAHNFKYKLELIESYDKRIKTLSNTLGTEALTNISQSLDRKSNVISGFDGFEKWMYYESTGSLYTHYSSSAYTIEPWPKYETYPNKLYSVTSSQAINYYNGLIDSASIFDAFNDARLTKMIPASIVEDPLNSDYVLFVDMIGHHYDITWSYIKALTSINEREEHPYDGMPNELLYDVAKSMGWKLTHGKDRSELWNFAVGTDKFGNYIQSGSLPSKSHEQVNYEVWRRIVNNIPYLLKSKGSARAVKALIATYGIPQTFLSIREYGGPMVEDVRPIWEHERFVYHLRMDTDNYITTPWDKINDIDPQTYFNRDPNPIDTIEIQFQQNMIRTSSLFNKGDDFAVILEPTDKKAGRGNIHFYLNGNAGYKSASINDVPLFDSTMSTLLVQREISVDDINQNNEYKLQYRRNRKDRISLSRSASIDINGSTESSYNAAWTGSGVLNIGKGDLPTIGTPSDWADAEYMSGSIQEIRYWTQPLKDIVVDEHTLSRESYHGNSVTSSYFDLKFRFIPDSQIKNVNSPYDGMLSQHPNRRINTTEDGRILSASLFNFESDDLRGVNEEYFTKVPSAGANNILSNKVRLEPNRLTGVLDPEQKKEKSKYDTSPVDSNQVGVYMSATKMYNEDIYNHTGYFEIDDYIGNPDRRAGFTEQNEELDYVRRQVFKKYSSRNLINTAIDILSRYDFSVFEQIRQTMPARVDYNSGILIEPHILERPKMKSATNLSYTNPQYDMVIPQYEKPISSEYIFAETQIPTPGSQSAEYIDFGTALIVHKHPTTAEFIQYDTILRRDLIIDATKHDYTSSIDLTQYQNITADKSDIQSIGNAIIRNQYAPSTYYYNILIPTSSDTNIGFGSGWTTGSNGYWNYNAIGTSVVNSKPSQYALKTVYFYNNENDARLRLSSSSSLVPSETSTDELPLSVLNLRFLGCKMTSDSLTTNSPDTPDGRPVIEIFQADPNVLIYTSQTAEEGNLDVDTSTNLPVLKLEDLKVNETITWSREQEYKEAVSKFRKKLQHMIEIEEARKLEFDKRVEENTARYENELRRREEFDIINRPDRFR